MSLMRTLSIGLVLYALLVETASARFTQAACFGNSCIQKNRDGVLCFHPSPFIAMEFAANSPCANDTLSMALDRHTRKSGIARPSTAYYDAATLTFIGGSDSVVEGTVEPVVVCHTGHARNGTFHTLCRWSSGDDDFDSRESQASSCGTLHGYDARVIREKCCGAPRSHCPASLVARIPPSRCPLCFRKFRRRPNHGLS